MSSLFKSPTQAAPPPLIMPSAPPPMPTMPDPMSPAAREASLADLSGGLSGQAGTNMTGNKKKTLGGGGTVMGGGTDSYSGTKLGGA